MIQDVTNNDAFEPEILEYLALKQGNKVAQLTIGGTNVDLYSASQETWESLLLIRTGSAEHNIKLSMRALKMGMKLMHSGLVKDGKIVAATEKDEKKNRLLNGCVSLELKFIPKPKHMYVFAWTRGRVPVRACVPVHPCPLTLALAHPI